MLINPLPLPLDLVGDKETNYIANESHDIVSGADRIFVPARGPFYTGTLVVRDKTTSRLLVPNVDYKSLHLIKEVSTISGKEVCAALYITKKEISGVTIEYRVPGGKYTELSGLYIELINNYGNTRKNVKWDQILGLPVKYPTVPHTHHYLDIRDIGEAVSAADLIINAIYSRDFDKYLELYEYVNTKVAELNTYKAGKFAEIEEAGNRILAKASPYPKEFWLWRRAVDPNVEHPFGTWERRGDYLLYGQMANGNNRFGTFSVKSGPGLVAEKVSLWQYMSHNQALSHSITANRTYVDEGQSITFTLTVTGVPAGTVLPYKLSGAMTGTGEFVTNAAGIATVTITTPVDNNTTGTKTLRMALANKEYIFKEVGVNDVVKGSKFSIALYSDQGGITNIGSVTEGSTAYIVVKTTAIPNGTIMSMIYGGNIVNDDLVVPLPDTVTINNNKAVIEISPKANQRTDGTRYISVGGSLDNYIIPSAATIVYVRDTSKDINGDVIWSNTDTGTSGIMSVSEGGSAYLVINTYNVSAGTPITLRWSGGTDASDFASSLPTSINASATGKTALQISPKMDNVNEGIELLTVEVLVGTFSIGEATIMIDDTNSDSSLNIRFSTNSLGTNNTTEVKEGTGIYLVATTEDIPDLGFLRLEWVGTTNDDDFLTALPTEMPIKENNGYVNILINPDNLTEGTETLTVIIRSENNVILGTRSIAILDTSTTPTYEIIMSKTNNVSTATHASSFNEGDILYAIIKTTQVPDGTTVYLDTLIGGVAATTVNRDVLYDVPKYITINDGHAIVDVHLSKDERADGVKNITMRLKEGGPNGELLATKTSNIADTSVVPTYSVRWTRDNNGSVNATSATAGQTVYAQISTTSLAAGTVIYLEYGGAGLGVDNVASDFLQKHSSTMLPRLVRVDSAGKATVPIVISKTLLGTVDLNLRLSLFRNAARTQSVHTSNLVVTKATYNITFSTNSNGTNPITTAREGQTIYAIIKTTNVPNNTIFDMHTRIGDEVARASNNDVTETVGTTVKIVNNIGSLPIKLKSDNVREGVEQLDVHILYDHMNKDTEMVYFATNTINITEI